jgi:hypothetical protein
MDCGFATSGDPAVAARTAIETLDALLANKNPFSWSAPEANA